MNAETANVIGDANLLVRTVSRRSKQFRELDQTMPKIILSQVPEQSHRGTSRILKKFGVFSLHSFTEVALL